MHDSTNDAINSIFDKPWPKAPHSLPAPKRECGVFCPGMAKNSIRTTGIKLASPQLVFASLAFGSGGNLHELWTVQVFSSLGAEYTIPKSTRVRDTFTGDATTRRCYIFLTELFVVILY